MKWHRITTIPFLLYVHQKNILFLVLLFYCLGLALCLYTTLIMWFPCCQKPRIDMLMSLSPTPWTYIFVHTTYILLFITKTSIVSFTMRSDSLSLLVYSYVRWHSHCACWQSPTFSRSYWLGGLIKPRPLRQVSFLFVLLNCYLLRIKQSCVHSYVQPSIGFLSTY